MYFYPKVPRGETEVNETFEAKWQQWVNTTKCSDFETHRLLEDCMEAATTLEELYLVARTSQQANKAGVRLDGLRPKVVRKMLSLVTNEDEVIRVQKLLGRRSLRSLAKLRQEIQEKINSFQTT